MAFTRKRSIFYDETSCNNTDIELLSLSLMLRQTVSRPVCLGAKHPFGAYDQIFITCVTVTVLFLWGALTDARSGLSFVYAAGSCQRSLSRVRISWDLGPYFTVSHLRLPFSSPSYDSQGHGGGIRPRLHTGIELLKLKMPPITMTIK
jgi:hypothetical protein